LEIHDAGNDGPTLAETREDANRSEQHPRDLCDERDGASIVDATSDLMQTKSAKAERREPLGLFCWPMETSSYPTAGAYKLVKPARAPACRFESYLAPSRNVGEENALGTCAGLIFLPDC